MITHPASPTIDHPLNPLVVMEGETAKFMVKVRGEPTPDVTWLVNDVAVYNVSQLYVYCADCLETKGD